MGLISGLRARFAQHKGKRLELQEAQFRARKSGAKMQLESLKEKKAVYKAEAAVRQEKKEIRSLKYAGVLAVAGNIRKQLAKHKKSIAPVSAVKGKKEKHATPANAHFNTVRNPFETSGRTALSDDYSDPEWLRGKKK